jgi:hypothetical protein
MKVICTSEKVAVRVFERAMTSGEREKFGPKGDGRVVGAEVTSTSSGHVYLSRQVYILDDKADTEADLRCVRTAALIGLAHLWGLGRVRLDRPNETLTPDEQVLVGLRPLPDFAL